MCRFRLLSPEVRLLAALLLLAGWAPFTPASAADGDLDPSWGVGGISFGFGNNVPRASGVAPDQEIYFTGRTTLPDDSEFEWWRTGNSGGGQWYGCSSALPLLDNFDIREVLFDSADRLLYAGRMTVFGTETVERAFVARFETFSGGESCTLDTAFSGAGWEYFDDAPYCDTEDCRLIDIEESGDATTRYVALLESYTNTVLSNYYLVGLTVAGNLDPNFGTGGFAPVTAPNLNVLGGGGAELVIDPSNRPYVLHSFYDPNASFDLDTGLTRFQSDGDLDTTFEDAGTYFTATSDTEDSLVRTMAIGSDGRIGMGWFTLPGNDSTVRVFLNISATSVGSQLANRDLRAVAFDGLGRILTAADIVGSDGIELGRRNVVFSSATGQDSTFGVNGFRFVDIDGGGANGELPVDIETPGGQPMILVEANQPVSGSQAYLVRLENSLVFADGFEWGSTKFW